MSSAAVSAEEMGRTAVRMLVQQLEGGEPALSVVLPGRLEVNESTGPAPEGAQ